MKQIRKRLTYANVMSSIAVFLVIGGGAAFAATQLPKNSVGPKQLKKGAVKTSKLGKEAVKTGKIAKEAINTNRLRANAVTGAKVNESTLGEVPNAAALGGTAASEYTVRYFARVDGNQAVPVLESGSPGVTVNSSRPFEGAATVNFPVDMSECAINATFFSGGGTVLIPRQSSLSSGQSVVIVLETPAAVSTNGNFSVVGVC